MLMSEKIERSRTHAAAALESYRAAHTPAADGTPRRADPDDLAAIGDLLADLLHLADYLRDDEADDPRVETLADRAFETFAHEARHPNEEV